LPHAMIWWVSIWVSSDGFKKKCQVYCIDFWWTVRCTVGGLFLWLTWEPGGPRRLGFGSQINDRK
jgi:hypothetical protein